jgi:RimJ/RimL family protein N-acetyltransferase
MAAATSWLDATQPAQRTVCMIDPANEPSIRVAKRLGFTEFARTGFRDSPVVLFERVRAGG